MRRSSLKLADLHLRKTSQRFITKIVASLLAVMAGFTLAQALLAGNALAQTSSEVKLEVVPESAELPAKGDVEVQVVLRNPTDGTLNAVQLSWFTSTNVSVAALESQDGKPVAPRTESVWRLRLTHGEEGLVSGKIHFRVNYGLKAGKEASASRAAFVSLEVKGRESDAIEKVAEVTVKTSITSLNENHSGMIYLVVANKSAQEISVGEVTSNSPAFIIATPKVKGVQKIAAHDSLSIPVDVTVTDAVDAGKHLLVFQIPLEWGKDKQKASLVASQELSTGVFGESEILTALGVPSFLILPGFLMLVTYAMFSRFGGVKKGEEESLFKIGTNPQFWVIAITLSIFMALLYPAITGLIGKVRRNYLGAYGLMDVVNIWFISIIIGALARGLVYAVRMLVAMYYTPSENDRPLRILKKLRWQGLGIHLPQVTLKIGTQDVDLFRIQERKGNQKTFWVAPYMILSWQAGVDDAFKKNVVTAMEGGKKLSDLLYFLEQEDKVTLEWDKTGVITSPHFTSEAEFTPGESGALPIIRE